MKEEKKLTRDEILEEIERLEEALEETDEEEEKLNQMRKDARTAAKGLKIMIEEYEKEGFEKEFAIELLKISLGGNK